MPLPCPKCGVPNVDTQRRCSGCGATLAAQTARIQGPGPTAMIESSRLEREEKDRQSDIRLRKRWVRHGIAGAIVFFVVRCLFDFAVFFIDPMLVFWTAVAAVLFGFPMGFIISRMNADRYRGAFVGGMVMVVTLSVVQVLFAGTFQPFVLVHFFIAGAIPGFAIGMHCELDR